MRKLLTKIYAASTVDQLVAIATDLYLSCAVWEDIINTRPRLYTRNFLSFMKEVIPIIFLIYSNQYGIANRQSEIYSLQNKMWTLVDGYESEARLERGIVSFPDPNSGNETIPRGTEHDSSAILGYSYSLIFQSWLCFRVQNSAFSS